MIGREDDEPDDVVMSESEKKKCVWGKRGKNSQEGEKV